MGQRHQAGAAAPVVQRAAQHPAAPQLLKFRLVDDGRAHVDAEGQHLRAAGRADVHKELGVLVHHVLLLRRGHVVRLDPDHARYHVAAAGLDLNFSGRQDLFGDTPQPLDADEAVLLDVPHHKAQRVHVREHHHHRRRRVGALYPCHAVAQGVGLYRQPAGLELPPQIGGQLFLMPRQGGDQGRCFQILFNAFQHDDCLL